MTTKSSLTVTGPFEVYTTAYDVDEYDDRLTLRHGTYGTFKEAKDVAVGIAMVQAKVVADGKASSTTVETNDDGVVWDSADYAWRSNPHGGGTDHV